MERGQLIAVLVYIGFILLFVLLGAVLWRGKGAFLIAGYNTASQPERAKWDEKALCRGVGGMMFAMAGCWGVATLGVALDSMALHWTGVVLFLAVIVAGMVYINTSRRFRRK